MQHHISSEALAQLTVICEREINNPLDEVTCKNLHQIAADINGHNEEHNAYQEFVTDAGVKFETDGETLAHQLMKSLDAAGYVIVKQPALDSVLSGTKVESSLLFDMDDTIHLAGKVVEDYTKNIVASHGIVSMTISFTDNTSLRLTAAQHNGQPQATLVAKYIEPA